MDTSDVVSEAAEVAREITKQGGKGLVGELKKVGQAAVGQILGLQGQVPSEEDLSKMKKEDKQFSQAAEAEVKAKIQAIYDECRTRRKEQKELEAKKEAEEEEVEKVAEINQLRRTREINPAVDKTRAEIKNYGAE